MSEFKVPLTTILEILPHNNADRLEIARIYGFQVIIGKDSLKVGDKVFYIPIDSIIPEELEEILFPPDSKIKLNKRRVKQIRIRKIASQGMILPIEKAKKLRRKFTLIDEMDYKKIFDIKKYEPPAPKFQGFGGPPKIKAKENPYFKKYGGIENYKWYPNLFEEGELVSVTEKIHGTHVRFGWAPFSANSFWKKVKKFFGLTPEWEWVYGSNNMQLQDRDGNKGYYGDDIYGKTLEKYQAKDRVPKGVIIHGEIYGSGIQKNYNYGCKDGEHKLIIFDIKVIDFGWMEFRTVQEFGKQNGFDVVPVLYSGPFNLEKVQELTKGDSILAPKQKVREGIVIKSMFGVRKVLKLISEKYLDGNQTDFH